MIRVIGRSPTLQIGDLLVVERSGDEIAQRGVPVEAGIGTHDGEGVLAGRQDEVLVS